jgi:hypothetical protein
MLAAIALSLNATCGPRRPAEDGVRRADSAYRCGCRRGRALRTVSDTIRSAGRSEFVSLRYPRGSDRRVPRVEEVGEADTAWDASALRSKAVDRLAELVRDAALPPPASVGDPT